MDKYFTASESERWEGEGSVRLRRWKGEVAPPIATMMDVLGLRERINKNL